MHNYISNQNMITGRLPCIRQAKTNKFSHLKNCMCCEKTDFIFEISIKNYTKHT